MSEEESKYVFESWDPEYILKCTFTVNPLYFKYVVCVPCLNYHIGLTFTHFVINFEVTVIIWWKLAKQLTLYLTPIWPVLSTLADDDCIIYSHIYSVYTEWHDQALGTWATLFTLQSLSRPSLSKYTTWKFDKVIMITQCRLQNRCTRLLKSWLDFFSRSPHLWLLFATV